MKKVWIASLLILALCLSLAACGGGKTTPDSVVKAIAAYGFDAKTMLASEKDYIDVDEDGDYILYSTASEEAVSKAIYNACKQAADDGLVRDFFSEEPIDFAFDEDTVSFYGYMRNGAFEYVSFSPYWTEDGVTEYVIEWN